MADTRRKGAGPHPDLVLRPRLSPGSCPPAAVPRPPHLLHSASLWSCSITVYTVRHNMFPVARRQLPCDPAGGGSGAENVCVLNEDSDLVPSWILDIISPSAPPDPSSPTLTSTAPRSWCTQARRSLCTATYNELLTGNDASTQCYFRTERRVCVCVLAGGAAAPTSDTP